MQRTKTEFDVHSSVRASGPSLSYFGLKIEGNLKIIVY